MALQTISSAPDVPSRSRVLSGTVIAIVCICYVVWNMGCVIIMGWSFLAGIAGIVLINALVFFLLQYRWSVVLYILAAAPSLALPLSTTGILSRLFIGNIVMLLLIVTGLVRTVIRQRHKAEAGLYPLSVLLPLVALACVGLVSIVYSRIAPDNAVVYSFLHSDISLSAVNSVELVLLLGLPLTLIIMPALIQTAVDVIRIVRTFIFLGVLYALGTIFAQPLGLYSQGVILNIRRPQVFGISSSILGTLLLLYACIALGQALYAPGRGASFHRWFFAITFGIAVILSFGRASWVALLIAGLVMIGLRVRTFVVLPMILGLLLIALVPGVTDFFNPDKVYGVDRFIMWQDAISIWLHHPYSGVGAGNYQFFDITYGIDVGGVAHNQFLEVLAEMGIQGLVCLIVSLFMIGRLALKRFAMATTEQGKAMALTYIGYYAGLLFLCFTGDFFLPSAAGAGGTAALIVVSYNWILLGLVLTLPQWEKTIRVREEGCQQ